VTATNPNTATGQVIELSPSYSIPLTLIFLAIPLLLWQPWISLVLALFGLFLMFQSLTIRLQFTDTALDIYRSQKLIRSFPYVEWQNWRIFWEALPILFYFKEVKSIHFLPILFNAKTLKDCLEQRCPLAS
jgi:hypothetical protein